MALYGLTVKGIALVAATPKTLIELATPSNCRAVLCQWWIEFDGTSASAVPVDVEFQRASAAVTTATTLAGTAFDLAEGASLMVTKHSTTTEGAGTLSGGEIHKVSPTAGILVQYPLGREWVVPVSAFWRLRATAAAGVNATCGLQWEE